MTTRNLAALIEGGLSRTTGFTPAPDKNSLKHNVQWLEHRLAAARIPLLNMKYVMGFKPNTFIIEAGCCIATFREQCHNSGLRFPRIKPLNGDNHSCWVEVDVDEQTEAYILWNPPNFAGVPLYFVGIDGGGFETSSHRTRAKVFDCQEDAHNVLTQAAIANGISQEKISDSWLKFWHVVPLRRD